jgi:hypothetical protein
MYRYIRLVAVVACSAALIGFLSGAPAGAASNGPTNATQAAPSGATVRPAPPSAARMHPPAVPTTSYGNGYFSYPGAGNVASASVTFTAPSFSCAHSDDSEWLSPGIWVFDSSGNLTQFSGAEFNCNSGAIFKGDVICVDSYSACDDSFAINPGDRVVASLYESSTQTVARVRNLTTGQSAAITGAPASDYTVFIGDAGPSIASSGAVTNIPTYTSSIYFTKAQVNGLYLSDWSPIHYNLKTGVPIQEVSTILSPDGDAFTAKFRHN